MKVIMDSDSIYKGNTRRTGEVTVSIFNLSSYISFNDPEGGKEITAQLNNSDLLKLARIIEMEQRNG